MVSTLWRAHGAPESRLRVSLDRVLGAIRAQLFDELVVYPQKEERGGPLPHEQADMSITHHLKCSGGHHRSHSHPQKHVRWELRCLLLDRSRDRSFRMRVFSASEVGSHVFSLLPVRSWSRRLSDCNADAPHGLDRREAG